MTHDSVIELINIGRRMRKAQKRYHRLRNSTDMNPTIVQQMAALERQFDEMSEYHSIPVSVAKALAESYAKSMVVILAYDPEHRLMHTTTYGVSAFDKEQAAAVGQLASQAIGCDLSRKIEFEDFHNDYDPARYRECLELLKTIVARHGCTTPMVAQAERILTDAGLGVRQG
jgi:hypothetical protein